MGDQWWLLLIGCAMCAVIVAVIIFGKTPPTGCPKCEHAFGLDSARKHCGDTDSYSGWGRDNCHCQNDYHWNYEATADYGSNAT